MRVAGLTSSSDWRFGRGKASYLTRSDAIRQNVVTRIKSFKDDWFANINHGLDWLNLLGQKGNEDQILREVERIVLATEGVTQITKLRIVKIDDNRNAVIELSFSDIFEQSFNESVPII